MSRVARHDEALDRIGETNTSTHRPIQPWLLDCRIDSSSSALRRLSLRFDHGTNCSPKIYDKVFVYKGIEKSVYHF